ncbi:MAG: tRNA uridine-5-carboxymethylaminomethyl(34) synthesis GTPase MnmE, partial [Leptospiraceae bacterium]|nr:tRNA uridine-5-carboxymethylaminomethyl(34) synthesis GTPase MnmE [Leptospiraceae bacterium]
MSSAPGRGAIALVRISGPLCSNVVEAFLLDSSGTALKAPDLLAARSYRCFVREEPGSDSILDDGLFLFFRGPASYTGEDTLEISLHGNPVIARHFILSVCDRLNIRPADPGEFTRRAFQNGKLDLLEAEGVRRIIDARSIFE